MRKFFQVQNFPNYGIPTISLKRTATSYKILRATPPGIYPVPGAYEPPAAHMILPVPTRACRRLPSRAREHAATSPLSRVTAAFPPASEYATASSLARDHACVLCLCDRPLYSAYSVSPALAWRFYQVPVQL